MMISKIIIIIGSGASRCRNAYQWLTVGHQPSFPLSFQPNKKKATIKATITTTFIMSTTNALTKAKN